MSADGDRSTMRARRHRAERLPLPPDSQAVARVRVARESHAELEVLDVARHGMRCVAAVEPPVDVGVTVDLVFAMGGREYFAGRARIGDRQQLGGRSTVGVELLDGEIPMASVRARLANRAQDALLRVWPAAEAEYGSLHPEMKVVLADLRALFSLVRSRLEESAARHRETHPTPDEERALVADLITTAVDANLPGVLTLFARLDALAATFSPEENQAHKAYFHQLFGETIRRTPFLHRALTKPLGYAGDFGLMLMFYEYEDLGEGIFDKFMHRISCQQPVAVANRNRVGLLADLIAAHGGERGRRSLTLTSIACGPARELQLMLPRLEAMGVDRLDAVLVDQESRALDYAVPQLRRLAPRSVDLRVEAFCEDAVLGTIKRRPFTERYAASDVIVCAGLFDYLPDRVAKRLVETIMSAMAPGALLLIGNVSSAHPNRYSMEYFMEWVLVLRSPDDLMDLVPERWRGQQGFEVRVVSEPLGINLFLAIRRVDD